MNITKSESSLAKLKGLHPYLSRPINSKAAQCERSGDGRLFRLLIVKRYNEIEKAASGRLNDILLGEIIQLLS